MTTPAFITQGQVLAAANTMGINHERVTEMTITPDEVAVTYLEIHETKRGTTNGPVVYTTHRYPIVKEPRA